MLEFTPHLVEHLWFIFWARTAEQMALWHHVVLEHGIENKPKISDCFIVTFVKQTIYDI